MDKCLLYNTIMYTKLYCGSMREARLLVLIGVFLLVYQFYKLYIIMIVHIRKIVCCCSICILLSKNSKIEQDNYGSGLVGGWAGGPGSH